MPCETFHCRAKKTPQFWSLHILKQLGLQKLEFLFFSISSVAFCVLARCWAIKLI